MAPLFGLGPGHPLVAAFTCAALSGALLALSFPSLGHPAAAWVALTPLLVILHGIRSPRLAFGLGLTTGAVHFAGTLPWLTQVMIEFGGFPLPVGVLINGLLVAYLALFPAAFAVMMVVLLRARSGEWWLLSAAPVWLTTELGRLWLLGGFPWELLGYSQTTVRPVSQLASLFGVHGVTLLVVFINSALALALVGPRAHRVRVLALATGVLGMVVLFGVWRLTDNRLVRDGTPLRVGLVQGNVAQTDKWDPAMRSTILRRYLDLSRQSAAAGARLIVWPEAAIPFSFEDHPDGDTVRQLARDTRAHLLFGGTQRRRDPPGVFNAAFVLRPDGATAAVYQKMHLVPFGEYVPFRSLLFFASPLVEAVAPFSPGTSPVTLPIGAHLVSTAICYEIIYPGLVRSFVRQGSELLTTITNDAWYGRSAAPHQHFQQAAMRAIEQGRYLVRAANTGISGVVDPYGRVLARSALFETAVMTEEVRLLRGLTLYGRIGDLLAYLCGVLTLGAVGAAWHAGRRAGRF